jgi:hypothetical protein
MVGAADNGEVVALSSSRAGALQASIGIPGARFASPATLAPAGQGSLRPAVAMDAAGDAVAVWQPIHGDCSGGRSCTYSSLGVFASLRPAGGLFGAPLRLAPPSPSEVANPLLAMNRRGDWLVVMSQATGMVVAAGRRASPPSAASPIPVGDLAVDAVALDEAGNATLSGTSDKHPSALVRKDDGSYRALEVLDDAEILPGDITIGVGPRGDGVAVWPAAGHLRFATRAPGGQFQAPVTSDVLADYAPAAIGVDAQGRTLLIQGHRFIGSLPVTLQASRGTVSAPFGPPAAVSDPAGSAEASRFAMAADGSAVLTWSQRDLRYNSVVQAARATAGGPFSAPLTLTRPNQPGGSDAAIDATGRAVLVWRVLDGDLGWLVAAALSSSGLAGPTLVTPEPQIVLQGLGHPLPGQRVRVRRDGTLRLLLTCVSSRPACRGTLRIDTLDTFRPDNATLRVGTGRFNQAAATTQQVRVRVSRAVRRIVARRSLKCSVLARTQGRAGGWVESTVKLTIRPATKRKS